MKKTAAQLGYTKFHEQPEKIYRFENGALKYKLPDGFRFFHNESESVDYIKLDACLHYGFNNGGEPDRDTDFHIHMHTTPNFNPMLPVIVIDESDGEYVGYANAFLKKRVDMLILSHCVLGRNIAKRHCCCYYFGNDTSRHAAWSKALNRRLIEILFEYRL